MRKPPFSLAFGITTLIFLTVLPAAQMQNGDTAANPFSRLVICCGLQRPPQTQKIKKITGKIEQIELEKNGLGWARSASVLWRTNDNGRSWREVTPPKASEQRLSGISFIGDAGLVVLANARGASFELAKTNNVGDSWTKQNLELPDAVLGEADFDRIALAFNDNNNIWLGIRLASSSNFSRAALFSTNDGGISWQSVQDIMELGELQLDTIETGHLRAKPIVTVRGNGKEFKFSSDIEEDIAVIAAPLTADESITALSFADLQNGWLLIESGRCNDFKSDCEQSNRLLSTNDGGKSWLVITPEAARAAVKVPSIEPNSPNVLPPNGSTRISMNRGFDKCTAAPVAQMQTWWNESPFYDSNIYISGRNRGCSQPQLTAAWVNQVSAQGWGLIPTVVGYQSPCSVCTNCQKHSSDPTIAETQGRNEADITITDANNLGLGQGTILYYDMERYDDLSGTGACSTPTKAFLKGWTDRLHEQGYISGAYGSPTNANNDWINIPAASRMDAVWMARWNNNVSVWGAAVAPLTDVYWTNHQRIHQYQGGHDETWGGVLFNIDSDISDAPVAGLRSAKNKPSDFDGDGKTDLAVFRPSTGAWYVLKSGNGSFSASSFGISEDIITPGDYDGDGKTDIAVFRPSTGIWYELSSNPLRPNANVIRSRQFGQAGDVPVAADYDGDGVTDLAVFRNGIWFITNSFDPLNPNFRAESFGLAGDLPVPGDYDGDGKTDLAVFRPSNGVWYILRSSLGFTAVQFGSNGDQPVQGDYDGDGKTDVGVFRPSSGVWYLFQSTAGFAATQFGIATDQPAPGDYDGDGKWDVSVFRPETGTWYLWRSQSGFTAIQFGSNGDKAVPAGYIP